MKISFSLEQRIKERVKSGMTIAKWCKNNGINEGQYYYWKSKIHKSSNTDEDPVRVMIRHIADGAEHIYLVLGSIDFHKQQTGY